jgi:plasmid stabilization system protein ParE
LQNLILFPDVGRPQKDEGVRKIVTRKYAYLIYYVVTDEIVILHPTGSARGMGGIVPERWAASPGFRKNEHAK